jgi:hypothetical protein
MNRLKQEAAFFENCDPKLVYIARKLSDALRLEAILTEAGFDYGVEPDRYRGGFIFQTERVGAFFYVRPDAEDQAREFLMERGYKPVVDKPAQ